MEEEWKQIDGYPGYYVSNKGTVRTESRIIIRKNGRKNFVKGRVLKPVDNGLGYKKVCLHNSTNKSREYVHRLVAMAFIPQPIGKKYINHKDCNPGNNNVNNLEWVTFRENMEYAKTLGHFEKTKEWKKLIGDGQYKSFKPVIGTNIETGEKIYFDRLNAVREKGFLPSSVCLCCKGKQSHTKGYTFKYDTRKHNTKE